MNFSKSSLPEKNRRIAATIVVENDTFDDDDRIFDLTNEIQTFPLKSIFVYIKSRINRVRTPIKRGILQKSSTPSTENRSSTERGPLLGPDKERMQIN